MFNTVEMKKNIGLKLIKPDSEWREKIVIDPRIRPKLFWRRPEPVEEIPDYREPMTGGEAVESGGIGAD